MKLKTLALAIASLPAAAFAADENLLDEIVVTATRTAQTADESLASVTVITRKDIEQSQANSVDELLRGAAGIDISRNGGYGKATAVFIRGTNADHVLVLVDGVRAASATLGEFAWQNLSPDQIERIEIVRGPRAALYGSDAVGGVVQIFTRKLKAPVIRVGLGSNNTREAYAGLGGGEHWHYSFAMGHFVTDGIPTNAVFTQNHGFENTHFTLGLEGEAAPGLHLDLKASHAEGQSAFDPDTGDQDFRNQVFSARLSHQVSSVWTQRLTLGHALDLMTSHSPYTPATITTRRNSLSWQHDLSLVEGGLTTLGIDYWSDHATKDNSGLVDQTLDTTALFAQHQWQGLGFDWLLDVRADRHDRFGSKTTGSLAWGLDLNPRTRLTASVGTAFKAPTVNDLFWPYNSSMFLGTTYITQGNPDLRPETSRSAEIGVRYRPTANATLGANLYRTRIDDLIEWQSTQTGPTEYTYHPANVSQATITGLELSSGARFDAWRLEGNLTFLRAEDDTSGRQLDRRPKRSAALKVSRDIGTGSLLAEIVAASSRNDRSGTTELGGYGIVNIVYRHAFSRELEMQARVENVFDKDYVLASSFSGDYNTLGRSLFMTLRYEPK